MRRRYRFFGDVQGVGFRWRAKHAAEHYGVTGYVENLGDGSVEMEAEGAEEQLDKLIAAIGESRYIDIRAMDVRQIAECGSLFFEIR